MKDNNFFNNLFDSTNNGSMEGSTPPAVSATLPDGDMGEFADSTPPTSIERKDEGISSDFEEKDYDSSDESITDIESPKAVKEPKPKKAKEDEGMGVEKPVEFSFSPIVSGWVEEGLFSEEDITNAEVEDSAEGIKKLITYSADKFKNAGKQEAFEELPDYLKEIIQLHKEGVDIRELKNIQENENDFAAIKEVLAEDEQLQEELYMDYLRASTNMSPDKAEKLIKIAKDTNSLYDYAETAADYLEQAQQKEKEKFIQSQKEAAKAREIEEKKRFEEFTKDILSTKEIKGFTLNGEKEAQELLEYMTKPDKKTGKTQEMMDWENLETRKAFALLNKRKFDFKSIEKKIETKKTIELKKKVENSGDKGLSNKGTRIEAEPQKRGGQIGGLEMYL